MNRVFNFHNVQDIAWFDMIVNILKDKYNFLDINEIENFYYNNKNLKNVCHITIDDGDISFYNVIYPVLKKYNIPATIFVSPSIVQNGNNFWFQEIRNFDKENLRLIISENVKIDIEILREISIIALFKNLEIDEIWNIIKEYKKKYNITNSQSYNMNYKQLIEIEKYGLVTIGAHTLNHPILANENDVNCQNEIIGSINNLSEILGRKIDCFAYPNGIPDFDFGQREINILKDVKCRLAFSTEPKNISLKDNPLSIPRFGFSIGNKYVIKSKLFLGKYWNKIKNLTPKEELNMRIKLKKINIQ